MQRPLPGGGRIHLDRLLPFLCVYRRDPRRKDAGTRTLVHGEAAYLSAPGSAPLRPGLRTLVRRLSETAASRFGALLIVEVWSAPDADMPARLHPATADPLLPAPAFRILEWAPNRAGEAANALGFALQRIRLHRQQAEVEVVLRHRVHPPGSRQLLTLADARRLNCFLIGLEVRPVYRDGEEGEPFPDVLWRLQRGLGRALKRAFYAFAQTRTSERPRHFHALGRRTLDKRVREVDRQLTQVGGRFDLLLQATPINAATAWYDFDRSGFQRAPRFEYRPLTTDPLLLKRELHGIQSEKVADPALAHLLRSTQDEIDQQITMLGAVGTRRFLPASLQLFGGADPSLSTLAEKVLRALPAGPGDEEAKNPIDARTLAQAATRAIRAYRRQQPGFVATARVREDMFSGLLASSGSLWIGRETRVPARRVQALIAHEVGTHLLTHYNGLAQPLQLLSKGLAGYDAFQEGLAVLAEYLVGGLSSARLRLLAARVLAVRSLMDGAGFVDTYRLLTTGCAFRPRTAFTVALRVHRGGGLTKDAIYLRGLGQVLEYLRGRDEMELLFVGKVGLDQLPVIRELLLRGVLRRPPLLPDHLGSPEAADRLARLKRGMSVLDLVRTCS